MSIWKKFRYRVEWLLVATGAWLVPHLPRWLMLRLAKCLGSLAYVFDKRGRTTALENLRVVFGDEKPEAERRAIAKRSFQLFARSMLDLFWGVNLTAENYQKYIEPQFDDPGAEARAKDGGIWITPHYGNFEWIALMMGFRGTPFHVVAQDFKNPLLTELFSKRRKHSGHEVIPQERAMIRLMKVLKRGGHTAFLSDLTVKPSRASTVIECFGFKTCVTLLHAVLVDRMGVPVVAGVGIPRPDGTYLMRAFEGPAIGQDASLQEIAQACWDVFEPQLREYPDPWLWMYKHWRFRPRGEGGERYPAYANHSKAFDKVAQRAESE
ncbi:MAG: lysophospholipid acyltransferase family protein [Verrucomicrobiales bacterium]